jgi:hypothetical protein
MKSSTARATTKSSTGVVRDTDDWAETCGEKTRSERDAQWHYRRGTLCVEMRSRRSLPPPNVRERGRGLATRRRRKGEKGKRGRGAHTTTREQRQRQCPRKPREIPMTTNEHVATTEMRASSSPQGSRGATHGSDPHHQQTKWSRS